MIFGNDPLAVERGNERDLEPLHERTQLAARTAKHGAGADEREHLLALPQRLGNRA